MIHFLKRTDRETLAHERGHKLGTREGERRHFWHS